jgi:hypothetical protein
MNEAQTTTKLLAIMAVIFVTVTLISLPYQSQVANAAPPGKKYQVYVTLTGVPANADNLILNATLNRASASSDETIVSSPSEGDTVKFVLRLASGTDINDLIVCGTQQSDPDIFNCDQHFFSSEVRGPIRVDFEYPT